MKYFAYIMCIVMVLAALGCASLSSYVTPAEINPKAVDYVVESGVAEAEEFQGYPNLHKATKLAQAILAAYEVNNLALKQLQEKNNLDYTLLNEVVVKNLEVAKAREEMLFSETGLLSMGLGLLGVGGLSGMLGLLRRKPGDWSPEEVESALEDVHTNVERSEEQVWELVKGVQDFIEADPNASKALKKFLAQAQSAMTKETVAKIKSKL